MFGFLRRAFSWTAGTSYIRDFHLDTAIKLPQKIETLAASEFNLRQVP
jgi:hypothetical protein